MKKYITIFLLFGFLLRILFVKQGLSGDITAFAEWGEKYWEIGSKNFYSSRNFYYTVPVYPPISNLLFASIYWLNEHRYLLAQIHNVIKIIPADFIIFFGKTVPLDPLMYNFGYYLLLKLLPILADLAISLIIYKIIFDLTKDSKESLIGSVLYLFNPVTIFLSGIWGQTDSLTALPAILGFYFLQKKKVYISIPLFFFSLYIKPSWAYIIPLYFFSLYLFKQYKKQIIIGILAALVIFLITTIPFGQLNFNQFVPALRGDVPKLSNSAFNFYTTVWSIDRVTLTTPLFLISIIFYFAINIFAFKLLKKNKNLQGLFTAIFIVGMGTYLFMPSMLERYFFPAFVPMIILILSNFKKFWILLISNLIFFANLFWSFYRRGSNELDQIFTNYNFLTIRFLSLTLVSIYIYVLKFLSWGDLKILASTWIRRRR